MFSLGLLSSEPVALVGTPLDALCDRLSQELVYGTCGTAALVPNASYTPAG